jgi:hypothetical protein
MIEALRAMPNSEDTTIKTFEFKLRANKQFVETSERELEHSRQIYNAALAERISCYQITGASLGYNEQSRHLTEARTLPEVKSHLRTIQQDALERVFCFFRHDPHPSASSALYRYVPCGKYLDPVYTIEIGCNRICLLVF